MFYAFFALFLFIISVMTHILFCRKSSQSGLQAKAFIGLAFLFLAVYVLGSWAILKADIFLPNTLLGFPFLITAGIIFILLIPVYLCFYVLTQLMSPSKKILLTVSQMQKASYEDMVSCVEQEDFINTRLSDLVTSGCVIKDQDRYRLSASGRQIAGILDLMQHVLGRKMGG